MLVGAVGELRDLLTDTERQAAGRAHGALEDFISALGVFPVMLGAADKRQNY